MVDMHRIDEVVKARVNAAMTALIVAIVGVIGTLLAPIVSQRLSARARREEFEMQRTQQQDEYMRQQREKALMLKRACYITVISNARRYRLELMRYLFAAKESAVDDAARDRLEEARLVFNTSLAESELTAAGPVREALNPIREGLSDGYRAIKDLENDTSQLNSSFEEIRSFLLKLWDAWPPAHAAMRNDLGVKELSLGAREAASRLGGQVRRTAGRDWLLRRSSVRLSWPAFSQLSPDLAVSVSGRDSPLVAVRSGTERARLRPGRRAWLDA